MARAKVYYGAMPELPEVHTTATGLNKVLKGLSITDAWTNYKSSFHDGKENIKNPAYFKGFKKLVVGTNVLGASRRGKNVLIHLSNGQTILLHMKMTGHALYGDYKMSAKKSDARDPWKAVSVKNNQKNKSESLTNPLRDDPFNKHIRFVLTLSNGKHVALSDMRRFAKITLIPTGKLEQSVDLRELGPEPLEKSFTFERFKERLMKRPNGKMKQVLMDQTVIAGIGNIYSDEMLWKASIHPLSKPSKVPDAAMQMLFRALKEVLLQGIDFGGDSMSDYRNVFGERGKFQHSHNAYRLTGKPCKKLIGKHHCTGVIQRKVIGGRSAHFCPVHQVLYIELF